ncbi:aminotransferase class V-fold PLP-dependent enzyme [Hwanghaeella sp.]|uniref:aminotransferase class V-fold PLP-dependent enzyme n=1 Tax=Hwanghaeella sp. TaxID=2605943 RepID=UPI003CCC2439
MSFSVAGTRQDTPACAEGLIHFNNAGASLMPRPVHKAVLDHLQLECDIGGYEAKAQNDALLERFYDAAARSVGGKRNEIAFIENATRAWDMAFYAFDWQSGDRILTSRADYSSNMISYIQVAKRYGVEIDMAPDDESGQIDVTALENLITDRTRLISLTHIPTNGGLINPVELVGKIARRHGIPYLVDACQSVGQMPIDVEEIGCDMLSTTGRKYIRGPRGTGFLWVRDSWIEKLEPPFLDNHAATWTSVNDIQIRDDAKRFENWECYFAGKIGLGVALDYGLELGVTETWARIQTLSRSLREGLSALPGVTVWDKGERQCGIVTFTKKGVAPQTIQSELAKHKINVSLSSRQLTRDDLVAADVDVTIRASVHYFNTEEELGALIDIVRKTD